MRSMRCDENYKDDIIIIYEVIFYIRVNMRRLTDLFK